MNIIKAHSSEEAVQKYLDARVEDAKKHNSDPLMVEMCGKMDKSYTQEQFEDFLRATVEYISTPKK